MKMYCFSVEIRGSGDDINEVWADAVTSFALESGPPPDEFTMEEEEDIDEGKG